MYEGRLCKDSHYNLAYSLHELGKKVLCVDFDSQANLSTCFGVEDTAAVPVTIGHLMMAQIEDEELPAAEEKIQSRNGVDFVSSSMVLSAVDAKLRLEMGTERMLSGILEFWKRSGIDMMQLLLILHRRLEH